MRKGVLIYNYFIEKHNETQLSSHEYFCNIFNNEAITDCRDAHALLIWRTFNLSNLDEYSDLYIKKFCC